MRMETMIMTDQVTQVPCNCCYCEGMVTEDAKDKKKTKDIISD